MTKEKKKLYFIIKLLFGLGLICILVLKIDMKSLFTQMESINVYWLALMVTLPHLGMLLSTLKWQWLLKALGMVEGLTYLFFLYLMGAFFSNFLPSMTGGDVVRVFQLSRKTNHKVSAVIAATFAERFFGITALITVVVLVLLNKRTYDLFPVVTVFVFVVLVGYIIMLAFVFQQKYLLYLAPLKRLKPAAKVLNILTDIQSKIIQYKNKTPTVIASYLVSLVFYFIAMCTVYAAAKSLNIHVEMKVIMVVVPLVLLAGLLPISIGGLGIQEGGYVFFFTFFGLSNVEAFSIALLLRARFFLTSMLGGLAYMLYGKAAFSKSNLSPSLNKTGNG